MLVYFIHETPYIFRMVFYNNPDISHYFTQVLYYSNPKSTLKIPKQLTLLTRCQLCRSGSSALSVESTLSSRAVLSVEPLCLIRSKYICQQKKNRTKRRKCGNVSATIITTPYTQLWHTQSQPKCRSLCNPCRNQSVLG